MKVIEQLANFITNSDSVRNLWLEDEVMKVYVRKGYHIVFPGSRASVTLDIASVSVNEENQQQGYWTNFLAKAHEMNPWEATFIECVLEPRLAASLLKHGWMNAPGVMGESYFMPKDFDKYYNTLYTQQKFGGLK